MGGGGGGWGRNGFKVQFSSALSSQSEVLLACRGEISNDTCIGEKDQMRINVEARIKSVYYMSLLIPTLQRHGPPSRGQFWGDSLNHEEISGPLMENMHIAEG